MRLKLSIALMIWIFGSGSLFAQGPKLGLGDPVPDIDIAQFFQGEEIEEFSKEQTYVLEFWATW